MPPVFVPRAPVLQSPRRPGESGRRAAAAAALPARGIPVLQSRREPSQLCLFLRHGALDVK